MSWNRLAQYIADILALLLIIRLTALPGRLASVYRVFCIFLVFQVLDSLVSLTLYLFYDQLHWDYRLIWMPIRAIGWVLSLWLVYAVLGEILKALPGILRFSRILLNCIFGLALVIALLTASPEYSAAGAAHIVDPIDRAVIGFFVLDRTVSMAALLILASILGFILWFPVQMSRNLAGFSVGLVIYFGVKVALFLLRSYVAHDSTRLVSNLINTALAACFAYWIFIISPQGQTQVRIGHRWRLDEQRRLLGQLESMNAALLRSAARR